MDMYRLKIDERNERHQMENVLRCFSVVLLLTLVGCGSDAEPPEQGALNQPAEIDRTSTLATEPITNGDDTSSPKKPGGGNFPPTGNPMPRTGIIDAIAQAREAARRSTCKNNLKMIGLAMHNHHSVHGQFPAAASMSTDGKPLLSWRVQLLPFLNAASLYNEFKLDEPWDSAHNKKLIAQMPAVFACPEEN